MYDTFGLYMPWLVAKSTHVPFVVGLEPTSPYVTLNVSICKPVLHPLYDYLLFSRLPIPNNTHRYEGMPLPDITPSSLPC